LFGATQQDKNIYLVDFGLSKRYVNLSTGIHIGYRDNKSLVGTIRYASINTHLGIEQSRRDDLESAMYVLLYFLKGKLPWQGLPVKGKAEKYKKIKDMKMETEIEELCKGLPLGVQSLLTYPRNLNFEEKPDYNHIRQLLKDIAIENNFSLDNTFDWSRVNSKDEWINIKEESKANLDNKQANESTTRYLIPDPLNNENTKKVENMYYPYISS